MPYKSFIKEAKPLQFP